MTHKTLTILLAVLMSMAAKVASAHDFQVDGIYYDITSSTTPLAVEVTYRGTYSNSYTDRYSGHVSIPESVTYNGKTYSVTSIGFNAFYGCSGLYSVSIPNSVTYISKNAFYCTYLKSVTIGAGVLNIGEDAFGIYKKDDYTNGQRPTKVIWLTNTPPKGYEYAEGTVNYVANDLYTSLDNKTVYPFLSSMFEVDGVKYVPVSPSDKTCDAIDCNYDGTTKDINIGQSVSYKEVAMIVKDIHPYALYEIKELETVTLANQGNIGNNAFANAEIKKKLNIANTVTDIGHDAFNGCKVLPYATIDNGGEIGYCAFLDCTALSIAGIGGKITAIGKSAFNGCSKLQWVDISNSVKTIGERAFRKCTSLASVNIGQNVESIGDYAFESCTSLPTLLIPKSLENIGDYTFEGCSALKTIIMDSQTSKSQKCIFEDWTSANNGKNEVSFTAKNSWIISVKSGDVLTFDYRVNSSSGFGKFVILLDGDEKSFERIGEMKSSYKKTFSTSGIVLLEVKYARNSYYTSRGEEEVSDMVKIYNMKLNGNREYEKENLLVLGSNNNKPLFVDCPLDSVYIGRNILYKTGSDYGYSPFYRNTSLRSIHISDVETEISPNEFYGCTNLKNVRLGDGITTIGDWAFSGCSSIDYFFYGRNMKGIGKEAFSDCTAMTRLISRSATPPTCGDQALDDINKWTCILNVPLGSTAAYKAAPQWKEFFFMEEGEAVLTAEEKVNVELSINGYATFYNSLGTYVLPSNLIAKVVVRVSGNKIVYETIADGSKENRVVPKGVPVMLESKEKHGGNYTLTLTERDDRYTGTNLLEGSDDATVVQPAKDEYVYKLSYGPSNTKYSNLFGWFWGEENGGAFEIPAHKAWLKVRKANAVKNYIIDDETTDIDGLANGYERQRIYYDLQGRQICKPNRKGLYIVNGKKIIKN